MDYIILGLLLMSNRTIYQLRERIEKGVHLMYSSSMGSIQAAIKKLLKSGYINYHETIEKSKYKKVYYITESGKKHFFDWVNAPIEKQNPRIPELTKVYFMGLADKEQRAVSIQQHLMHLNERYEVLTSICEEAQTIEVPNEYKDILNYQYITALYGKELMKFNINWFENLLRKMRNNEI